MIKILTALKLCDIPFDNNVTIKPFTYNSLGKLKVITNYFIFQSKIINFTMLGNIVLPKIE